MPEITSRQAAKLAATTTGFGKQAPHEALGKKRIIVITTPATHSAAQNDTIGSGIPLPIGTRLTSLARISCNAGAASSQMSVGIRNFATKAEIDADGIGAAVTISSATVAGFSSGALVTNGVEYVTTEVSEIYATWTNAAPQANQQIRLEVEVITPD